MKTNLLSIYDGRIMPNIDDEKPCSYGCRYCFATNNDFIKDPNRPKPMTYDDARERIIATIEATGDTVHFVNSACSREIFEDEIEGLKHVNKDCKAFRN